MVKHITIKKGYTLLEMLLGLMIISSLLFVTSFSFKDHDFIDKSYPFEYLKAQTSAITLYKDMSYDIFSFNTMGGVNKADTRQIGSKVFIVHLGTGYLSCE